jgi:hypothetical protein
MPSNTFNGDRIFGKKDRQFYEYRTFYNDNLRDRVARLYACDFSQYRYDVNEI